MLTRNRDIYVDHADRSKKASDRRGYIFVSIHFNEDSSRETTGWETYALSPQYAPSTSSGGTLIGDEDEIWPGNQFDHQNFLLTQAIHRAAVLSKSNAPADRGVKRARFKVLRLARAPSVLVEGGFMSNPREAALLKTEEYRQQVARWIFEGILAYKRSQEAPEESARLKVAVTETPQASPAKLEGVPDFRSKADVSDAAVAPGGAGQPTPVAPGVSRPEIPKTVSKTNPPVDSSAAAERNGIKTKENPVRKAQSGELEIRKAIPVTPGKTE